MVDEEIAVMKQQVGASSDAELARILGYSHGAIIQWRYRQNVPNKAKKRIDNYLRGEPNTPTRRHADIPHPQFAGEIFDAPLHPEEIKARLRIRYGTIHCFEQAKELSQGAVSQVINTGLAWETAARAIAEELGIPLHRVSTHYYRKFILTPVIRKGADAHRQNAEAR